MRRVAFLTVLAATAAAAAVPVRATTPPPQAVVALIDTGINPYSPAFRDDSPLAYQHPSTYIPGYPPPCPPIGTLPDRCSLALSLDKPTLAEALEADRKIWEVLVASGALYWIPGTKIIGLISLGAGSTHCPIGPDVPPANGVGSTCGERRGLDDAGHGTMTASRAAGVARSLGASARIVMIEGLGAMSTRWAAQQPWIDVQSNSWATYTPVRAAGDVTTAFRDAAKIHMVVAASGNGLGGFFGFTPNPTLLLSTAPPGVVTVGAHDNGKVTVWHGSTPLVVADGYGGYTARHDTLDPMQPHPIACCTSTAAPYAAGGAAAIAYEARRILGDARTGVRNGIVAEGPKDLVPDGPLKDGDLTLEEWRRLLLVTAEARPRAGVDDGLIHFTGTGQAPQHPEYGPGENPFCPGCWTLPLDWTEVPSDQPAYPSIGYGAINERAVALAGAVLRGEAPMPERPAEDAFFAQEGQIRSVLFGS